MIRSVAVSLRSCVLESMEAETYVLDQVENAAVQRQHATVVVQLSEELCGKKSRKLESFM